MTKTQACGTHPSAKRWLSRDPCGWVCAVLVHVFLAFAAYSTTFTVLPVWPASSSLQRNLHQVGYLWCIFMAVWSHLKTMLTDPGSVPPNAVPLGYYDNKGTLSPTDNYCKPCKAYKPRTSHHCSTCQRCIVRMDHHCPWANTCIGQNNHKAFILFVSYTLVACIWTMYLVMNRAVMCSHSYERDPTGGSGGRRYIQLNPHCDHMGSILTLVLLGVEAVMFGLFTCCMLCDASSMFASGQTQVDHFKHKKSSAGALPLVSTWADSFAPVFGGDGTFSPWWLVPVDAKWKNPSKQFGFMLPIPQYEHRSSASALQQSEQQEDLA